MKLECLSTVILVPYQRRVMINSLQRHLWWFSFKLVARFNFWYVASWLLVLALKKPSKNRSIQRKKRLLVLSKRGLFEDVESAFEKDSRFEVWYLDMVRIKPFKAMVSEMLPAEIDDFNYLSADPEIEAGKRKYRAFTKQVLKYFLSRRPMDAVLTASFSYYAEREVGAAFEYLGIPFIALHKENLKTPGIWKFYEEVYRWRRGPFHGRRILVYNNIEKHLQVSTGIALNNQITVTGMPRLDRIHFWRQAQKEIWSGKEDLKRQVPQALFFAFGPKTGLPRMARKLGFGLPEGLEQFGDERDLLSWKELSKAYYKAIIRVARRMPESKVIIKAKPVPFEINAIQKIIEKHSDIPNNLEIISHGDPMTIIQTSTVICGFRTTALFEAMAAGKPLIIPHFAEAKSAAMAAFILDLGEAAEYADSEDDLVEKACKHLQKRDKPIVELTPNNISVLEKWTGNSDGNAGTRVANAVMTEINGSGGSSSGER